MKVNKYKSLGSGWHNDNIRHQNAKLFGVAGGLYSKNLPDKVDLGKYAGKWEQVKVVNEPFFQRGCEKVVAIYKPMPDGRIKVINKCYSKGQDVRKIEGTARSVNKRNTKLKVQFFPFIEGDYNIKELNPSYTKAKVTGGRTTWYLKKIKG